MRRVRLFALIAAAAFILCSCGSGTVPPLKKNGKPGPVVKPPDPELAHSGKLKVRLKETGDDIGFASSAFTPMLEKLLSDAGVEVVQSEEEAGLIVHGTVRLRRLDTKARMGLDYHRYGAQASWQLIRVSGYRTLLRRESSVQSEGTGKQEAVNRALSKLAEKLSQSLVPKVKKASKPK